MEQGKEYYAFISYKREDEKWAKWLQDKLEHYKFPTNLNGRTDLPKNIRPTFRDVTDLKPGLLAEEIDNALVDSQWLIIVCSPRSAKSPWVCKEAQTFIDLGCADHIIPFVIEGNPFSDDIASECYPEALLYLTGIQELLAANINEMGRDAAVIKVVARMFGLRFDTLWQRHEKEKRHRRNWIVAVVAVIALAVFGVAAYIWRQNNIISKSRAELQSAYNNLSTAKMKTEAERMRAEHQRDRAEMAEDSVRVQYGIIKQANFDLQRTNNARSIAQSRAIAEKADLLIQTEDYYLARRVAVAAINECKCITPEIESILRRACQKNSAVLRGHTDCVDFAIYSPDGKHIASSSLLDSSIRIWDALTGKLLKTINHGALSLYYTMDGERIVSHDYDSMFVWDVKTGFCRQQTIMLDSENFGGNANYPMDKNRILSHDGRLYAKRQSDSNGFSEKIVIGNNTNGEIVNTIDVIGDFSTCEYMSFSPDGKQIVSVSGRLMGTLLAPRHFDVYDVEGGNVRHSLRGHTYAVNSANFSPDGKGIVSCSDDYTVRIWDIEDCPKLKTVSSINSYAFGNLFFDRWNDATTTDTVEHPNGRKYCITYSNPLGDGIISVNINDANTGKFIQSLESYCYDPWEARFIRDGMHIITWSKNDGSYVIWEFPPIENIIEETRERFKDYPLTPEERRQYYLE